MFYFNSTSSTDTGSHFDAMSILSEASTSMIPLFNADSLAARGSRRALSVEDESEAGGSSKKKKFSRSRTACLQVGIALADVGGVLAERFLVPNAQVQMRRIPT